MTPPDRLVQAAAETKCQHRPPCESHSDEARVALAAAFAAWPECPDPIDPTCCQNKDWRGLPCQYHQGYADGWDALAREFGEPT